MLARIPHGQASAGCPACNTRHSTLSVNTASGTGPASPAGAVLRLWSATPISVRDALALTAAVVVFVSLLP